MSGVLHGVIAGMNKNAISVVNTYTPTTLSSGVTSITLTGLRVGDFLVAAGGSQQLADPSVTAGWTKAVSANSSGFATDQRVIMVVSKRAESTSETVSFTGTGVSSSNYSYAIAFRDASLIGGTSTFANGTNSSTVTLPSSLTLQNASGSSAIACFVYSSTITGNNFGFTTSNSVTYGLSQSSWQSGRTLTSTTSPISLTAVVEVLN